MIDIVTWLYGLFVAYAVLCLIFGLRAAWIGKSATDFMVAGRALPTTVFALAATAVSFSGFTFLQHPGLIYEGGLQYAATSLAAVAIPFAGLLFLKRQWLLGKRFGFVTPGEMYGEYFRGDGIRVLVLLVAFVFAVPFIAVQLRLAGGLVETLTGAEILAADAIWLLAGLMALYTVAGGLRAVATIGSVQFLLFFFGMATLGVVAIDTLGGLRPLTQALGILTELDPVRTSEGFSHFVAVPGTIQLLPAGLAAEGGPWTGLMVLTFIMALMGVQTSPAFTMWAFSVRDPQAFGVQQVWISGFLVGGLLVIAAALQAFSAHALGANAVMNAAAYTIDPVRELMPELRNQAPQDVVIALIELVADTLPWLAAIVALGAIAAIQSTAAAHLVTFASMLTRDLVKHFIVPTASHGVQRFFVRAFTLGVLLLAVVVSLSEWTMLFALGSLAAAIGFQLWPTLLAVCYVPWITRTGVTVGLVLGIIAVVATEKLGVDLAAALGYPLPWGRWPLTLHSAFWGMAVNLIAVIALSAATQNRDAYDHKLRFHTFLAQYAGMSTSRRGLIPLGWILAVLWFFFAVGPGLVVGDTLFGDPNDTQDWAFGLPSLWLWQIAFWLLGVFMLWFLAFRLQMSDSPRRRVEALVDDIGDLS